MPLIMTQPVTARIDNSDKAAFDAFYPESNQAYLMKSVQELRSGQGHAHELIEVNVYSITFLIKLFLVAQNNFRPNRTATHAGTSVYALRAAYTKIIAKIFKTFAVPCLLNRIIP